MATRCVTSQTVRQIVHDADSRVPITNVTTQAAEIDQTINQEIVLARLCTAFAILALVIACVGLYGTMAYAVARRTSEIGIRMALGAQARGGDVDGAARSLVLAALGLAISLPLARGSVTVHRVVPVRHDAERSARDRDRRGDARRRGAAGRLSAPARRASRIEPTTALRHE